MARPIHTVRSSGIPTPDPLTPFREPNDIDKAEEAAWSYIEMMGFVPTPQLLFALKEVAREMMAEKDLIAYCQRKMKEPGE